MPWTRTARRVAYQRPPLLGRKAGPRPFKVMVTCPGGTERRPAPADLRRDLDPVTGPVRPPSRADQAWADLAAELAPAKSLARIDAVTARAVTTITVVGVLLTGLGAASTALPAQPGPARVLAAATVITAALAVTAALTAQVLTITRHLNPANLAEVKGWYRRQFRTPRLPHPGRHHPAPAGRPARRCRRGHHPAHQHRQHPHPDHHPPPPPPHAATQQATVTVSVTFHDLAPGQPATVMVTTPGAPGRSPAPPPPLPLPAPPPSPSPLPGRRAARHRHRHRPPPHLPGHPQPRAPARPHLPQPLTFNRQAISYHFAALAA